MATLDDDLAKAVTEGFRLAQGSIINQDLILSGSGDVTVTLADGSKKTGPSWSKLIAQAMAAGDSAAAAKASEKNAKTSETNANTSKNAAADSAAASESARSAAAASQAAAKLSEDRSKTSENNAGASASSAAASLAAAQKLTSAPYEAAPFPDVWLPLNDDLRLLAGFAPYDRLTISGQILELATKSVTFARSTIATYIDKSGVLQTANIDEPRFEKEGLLIEGQSTNYFLNSDDPTKWAGKAASLTVTAIKDGTTQAATMKGVCNNAVNNLLVVQSSAVTLADGDNFTVSARFKGKYGRFRFRIVKDSTFFGEARFIFSTGATAGSSGGLTLTTKTGSDGYTLATATLTGTAAGIYTAQIYAMPEDSDTNNIPVSTEFYIQTVQFEKNAAATSYIPTGSAAVTRAADDCTLQRSGNDNYPGPITFSVEMHCNGETVSDGTANSRRGILSFYPSTTEFGMLMLDSSTSNVGKYLFAYGPATFNVFDQRVDNGEVYRIAATFDGNNISALVNGEANRSPTPVTRPAPGDRSSATTRIYLGRGAGASTSGVRMLNGHIRNLRIWHRALTPNQIKGLR